MARKAVWKEGELFAVPLEDGLAAVGQVLSVQKRALNLVVCAFSLLGPDEVRQQGGLRPKDVISGSIRDAGFAGLRRVESVPKRRGSGLSPPV